MNKSFSIPEPIHPVDATGVEERIARLSKRSIKKDSKVKGLLLALSMCDLTTLEGKDSCGKVEQLCIKARRPMCDDSVPHVAAVCVYPSMVSFAYRCLKGSDVKIASVATGFPSGLTSLQIKLDETRIAVGDGADEVDMVISRGKFLEGEYAFVYDEIAAVKQECGNAQLKVILETGELGSLEKVRLASELAIAAGADFVKTSTGKTQPAATLPVTLVMLETIRDHFYATGKRIGMKPAGGISNSKTALQYLVLLYETLGSDWMTPQLFRFGASSLVNDLLMQLVKQRTGVYPAAYFF